MKFTVPGIPVCWKRPRIGKWGGFYDADTKAKKIFSLAALTQRNSILRGDLMVTVLFFVPDRRRRDIDNMIKHCFDSLNRVVFNDDSQVTRLVSAKIQCKDGEERTEIEIIEI